MEHIAIMEKSWGLLPRILTGEKTVESRWLKYRCPPFNAVRSYDHVYFKDSGGPVWLKARVIKVLQFEDLSPYKVEKLLKRWALENGIRKAEIPKFFQVLRDKRYCVLIFLGDVETVKPFQVDKSGFGAQAAWISVEDVNQVRIEN